MNTEHVIIGSLEKLGIEFKKHPFANAMYSRAHLILTGFKSYDDAVRAANAFDAVPIIIENEPSKEGFDSSILNIPLDAISSRPLKEICLKFDLKIDNHDDNGFIP